MKTTLYFTLTLFIFLTLTFVPNSFAQNDSPEYVVRVIYLIPNNREPDPNMDSKLDTLVKDMQKFYADQMEAHGFDRKTFRYETDENGNAKVHHVNGKFGDAYYRRIAAYRTNIVWDEIAGQFDMSRNIYFLAVDISSSQFFDRSVGIATGSSLSGRALIPASYFGAAHHELGHAFGLQHDWRDFDDVNLIQTSGINDGMTTSFCAAEWLDVNRYFNTTQETFDKDTSVQMLTPSLDSPPDNFRLKFEVTDPDGLHQAQLLISSNNDTPVVACQKISGNSTTVEFVSHRVESNKAIILQVIDKHGNFTRHRFEIDVTNLLPPAKVISIPDRNLATAVRETLGLASRDRITQLDMLRLSFLLARNRQITNLTGLEHAIHLHSLNVSDNQINDITPLLELKKLRRLDIAGHRNLINDLTPLKALTNLRVLHFLNNPNSDITFLSSLKNLESLLLGSNYGVVIAAISDFSPVWELTQLRTLTLMGVKVSDISPLTKFTRLRHLQITDAEVSDISPLAGLTNLNYLFLRTNQITDVSPLKGLVNLQELHLQGNPIKDRKPLLELLEKNPNVKIYLKNNREPLPVNLSHFRAEHTDAGVILKWTTESEVDNAGFYLYRSQTRDGEFKVVNPTMIQGAGTSSERHAYTWTDTTAKPNVAYYYRIEDISHAGVRKQLATVRMRGLVSASGKLTTRWADLKTQEE
ncbi:MAG: hypothetical protein OYL97_16395 [Candidatus Poribacteria bacterium]|nr:hypothetical protein [Candidatus Poribacteria bacterium]